MPLTPFQERVAALIAADRTPDSYLAGGAALHVSPTSQRYSNDLDYFQDSVERASAAFAADRQRLLTEGFKVEVTLSTPGFSRAVVSLGPDSTKVDWAHDASWRFFPALPHAVVGYLLHPVDLAVNKLLALVGRDEPRDFLDVAFAHRSILSLGALCWAAAGKDPGFTPPLLLDLLKRRGRLRPEELGRLRLREVPDLTQLKLEWLAALEQAERFVAARRPEEIGCLYFSRARREPLSELTNDDPDVFVHHGSSGGALPSFDALR